MPYAVAILDAGNMPAGLSSAVTEVTDAMGTIATTVAAIPISISGFAATVVAMVPIASVTSVTAELRPAGMLPASRIATA